MWRWDGERWWLHDLGSPGGTWVDGRRLAPGVGEALVQGAVLGFGAAEGTHELVDASPPGAARHARLDFRVSRDEESVALVVREGARAVSLGVRSHHYLLLLLARRRLTDVAGGGVDLEERGWVDLRVLAGMVRADDRYLEVLIHRARRQAREAGLGCADVLVERRLRSGQVRLGVRDVRIDGWGGDPA